MEARSTVDDRNLLLLGDEEKEEENGSTEYDSEGSEIEIPDITVEKYFKYTSLIFYRPEFGWVREGNLREIRKFLDRLCEEKIKGYINEVVNLKGDTVIVNLDNSFAKLLHTSVNYGQTIILELLVDFGAKLDAFNKDGFTPLHIAVKKNNLDQVKILVHRGANVIFSFNSFLARSSFQR